MKITTDVRGDIRKTVNDVTALVTANVESLRAELAPAKVRATAQNVPGLAISKGFEVAGKAESVYSDLSQRGKHLARQVAGTVTDTVAGSRGLSKGLVESGLGLVESVVKQAEPAVKAATSATSVTTAPAKPAAKKSPAKRTTAKKAPAKKSTAKTAPATKATARKAPAKKSAASN